jgi:hypothetical protein
MKRLKRKDDSVYSYLLYGVGFVNILILFTAFFQSSGFVKTSLVLSNLANNTNNGAFYSSLSNNMFFEFESIVFLILAILIVTFFFTSLLKNDGSFFFVSLFLNIFLSFIYLFTITIETLKYNMSYKWLILLVVLAIWNCGYYIVYKHYFSKNS